MYKKDIARNKWFAILTIAWIVIYISACSSKQPTLKYPDLKITNVTLTNGIEINGSQKIPGQPTSLFSAKDDAVFAFIDYDNLTGNHTFRWEWIDPAGGVYLDTGNHKVKAPADSYVEHGSVWHQIKLSGEKAETLPGNWKINVYMDNQLISANSFQVSSTYKAASSKSSMFLKPVLRL